MTAQLRQEVEATESCKSGTSHILAIWLVTNQYFLSQSSYWPEPESHCIHLYSSCCKKIKEAATPLDLEVLRKISHPNIVRFRDLKKSQAHFYLVLEWPGRSGSGHKFLMLFPRCLDISDFVPGTTSWERILRHCIFLLHAIGDSDLWDAMAHGKTKVTPVPTIVTSGWWF